MLLCLFKCLKGERAACPVTSHVHEGKMAAALERSFIEICGFERETLNRFREVSVNLGEAPNRVFTTLSSFFFVNFSYKQTPNAN